MGDYGKMAKNLWVLPGAHYPEPITRSVQLPYSLYETAFSQVGLFLDKPFPRIGFQ